LTAGTVSLLALTACASPGQSVIQTPCLPTPQVNPALLKELPPPLYFQNELKRIFDSSHEQPMK